MVVVVFELEAVLVPRVFRMLFAMVMMMMQRETSRSLYFIHLRISVAESIFSFRILVSEEEEAQRFAARRLQERAICLTEVKPGDSSMGCTLFMPNPFHLTLLSDSNHQCLTLKMMNAVHSSSPQFHNGELTVEARDCGCC